MGAFPKKEKGVALQSSENLWFASLGLSYISIFMCSPWKLIVIEKNQQLNRGKSVNSAEIQQFAKIQIRLFEHMTNLHISPDFVVNTQLTSCNKLTNMRIKNQI